MVAIIKKQLKIEKTLNEILQIVSVSIFEQTPLHQLLTIARPAQNQNPSMDEFRNLLLFSDL
jgi:hypothetical protein